MVKEHAPPLPLIKNERSLNPETEVFILFICVTDEYFFRFLKGEIVQEGKRWLIIILSYSMTPMSGTTPITRKSLVLPGLQ